MPLNSVFAFVAALLSGALGLLVFVRKKRTLAGWFFCAGMAVLSLESTFNAFSLETLQPEDLLFWQNLAFVTKSFLPGIWVGFSLIYSRGNYREFLVKRRLLLAAVFLLPSGIALGFRKDLLHLIFDQESGEVVRWLGFGPPGQLLNILLLGGSVLILMNLEATFRSAVGTMRWRIKFLILGVGVIFGTRIYTRSQTLLFSGHNLALTDVETGALLIGCVLVTIAYSRKGFAEIDIYPSRTVLHSSVTALLVGGYLLVVGVLAKIVASLARASHFQIDAFVVLLGIVALAVLLFSERVRLQIKWFVSRHFKTPHHDFRQVWTLMTRRMSEARDQPALCAAAAKLISGTFNVLSVTIWLVDRQGQQLRLGGSTSEMAGEASSLDLSFSLPEALLSERGPLTRPFDLEKAQGGWAEVLKKASISHFRKSAGRLCVPLHSGERWIGFAVLADRVNQVPFTVEELDLLTCISEQVAGGLLGIGRAEELMSGKELEAFQTMSAFFVHDLKNAASSLGLMLENLPVHFDDPVFRADALRGIGSTADRINQLIARLSSLRNKFELRPATLDLNGLVTETLAQLKEISDVDLTLDLSLRFDVNADREQMQSVLVNLLLNARDAAGKGGALRVETSSRDGRAFLSVSDNGCGMTPHFLKESLFRPFHTTKKKGLGIGMFQAKSIVEAHGGHIRAESLPGKGSTFHISLPLEPAA